MAGELVTGLLAVLSPGMATPGEGSFATRSVSRQGAITTGSFVTTLRVENPVRAGLVEAVCADEAVATEGAIVVGTDVNADFNSETAELVRKDGKRSTRGSGNIRRTRTSVRRAHQR